MPHREALKTAIREAEAPQWKRLYVLLAIVAAIMLAATGGSTWFVDHASCVRSNQLRTIAQAKSPHELAIAKHLRAIGQTKLAAEYEAIGQASRTARTLRCSRLPPEE